MYDKIGILGSRGGQYKKEPSPGPEMGWDLTDRGLELVSLDQV